jgi:CRISPR-associated protein Cas5h
MPKVLVFDIWGELAHFKKPYTTTSPLTYSIPSRTTLTGIIGAIIGIPKGQNNVVLNRSGSNITLGILEPIKKVRIAENLINTKEMKFRLEKGRTQIKIEFLSNPRYRVYVALFDPVLYETLKSKLINHQCVFTPTLGLSENLANFEWVGEFEVTQRKGDALIRSVINQKGLQNENIEFETGKEYFTDTFAMEMQEDRVVTEYGKILFERNGKPIKAKNIEYFALENNENIVWL